MVHCKTNFIDENVDFAVGRYSNNRLAIYLVKPVSRMKVANVTVNIPEIDLEPDEIVVMNWSENEGMLDFLLANELVEKTNRSVQMPFTGMEPIVKITDKFKTICGMTAGTEVAG